MKQIATLVLLGSTLVTSAAFASQESYYQPKDYYDSSFFTTLQVGTLGPGLNIGYQFSPYFDLRANVNGLKYSRDETINDVKYDADLKLLTAGLLADYYPFQNGFRLTAGAYYNGNKLSGTGHATKDYYGIDINDYGYEKASVDYKKFAPYVGFGYQTNDESSNWMFTADLGVMYQGKAKVQNSTVCYNGAVCTLLKDQIDRENAEQRSEIQDKADKLKWYPVASIGIGYRF